MKKPLLIAEVKTQSPFGYKSKLSWDEQFKIANKIGDIVSIHTNEKWGGGFELLDKAISLTNKPILAKGLHVRDSEINDAFTLGAEYVLTARDNMDTFLDGDYDGTTDGTIFIEPKSLCQLKKIIKYIKINELDYCLYEMRIVWNQRDLDTGLPKKETFKDARKIWKGWMCQASMIKTKDDIDPSADAVLIGEHLQNFIH